MNQARGEMLKDKLSAIDNILCGVSNHDALGILVGAIGKVFSGYSSFAAQNNSESAEQSLTQAKAAEALPEGEITPPCSKCNNSGLPCEKNRKGSSYCEDYTPE